MYKLLSAQGIPTGGLGNWVAVDAANMGLDELFREYQSVIVRVADISNNTTGYFDLYTLPTQLRIVNLKLQDYLDAAPSFTLPVLDEPVVKGNAYVRFIFANGYELMQKGMNRNFHIDSELVPAQMIDLLLYKEGITDYPRIAQNAIFTINGLIHLATDTPNGIMIYDGARNMYLRGDNRVGIYDFSKVGEISCIPITDDMIIPGIEGQKLSQITCLNVPGGITGKSVFMVVAGMFYPMRTSVRPATAGKIRIDWRTIDLVDQFYTFRDYMDLPEDWPLTPDLANPNKFVFAEFYTDEYIKALLKLPNSFILVVDNPNVTVDTKRLANARSPGLYGCYGEDFPDLPVQIGHGLMGEYNYLEREGFFALKVPNYIQRRPVTRTTTHTDLSIITDQNEPYHPRDYASADFLYIRSGS